MSEPIDEPPLTHPEEMRGSFDLRIGKHVHLTGQGRLTPANIVAAGLMTAAILAAAAALVRAART